LGRMCTVESSEHENMCFTGTSSGIIGEV